MDDECIDNLILFIKEFEGISNISISWYGGEPLLALNIIEKITYKITYKIKRILKNECSYNASIVTKRILIKLFSYILY